MSSISIALPNRVYRHLKSELGTQLERKTQEALAIEGYRLCILSLGEVAEILNFTIDEADGFLKQRNIDLLITGEDVKKDTEALLKLLK